MPESTETYKRIVVEGSWSGDVLPGKMDELRRTVTIRPRAEVSGAVFGHDIRIEGPCLVRKAVYATHEVTLAPNGPISLKSSLGSRDIIVVDPGGEKIYIDGDVVTRAANLSNVIIRGNVHVDQARISNSIILGTVTAATSLEFDGSIMLTASAMSIRFGERCGLLLPHAEANDISIAGAVALPLLGPVSTDALTSDDIVVRNGKQCLGAGRRVSNLAKAAKHIEATRSLVLQATIGGAPGWGSEAATRRELIAPTLHPLLGDGPDI